MKYETAGDPISGLKWTRKTKVERFTSTPDVENYLKHWYEPTGKLKIHVLALHNEYDAIVPYYHEEEYFLRVEETGSSDMLEQWPGAEPFGHCNFSPGEIGAALYELKYRVEHGVWLP